MPCAYSLWITLAILAVVIGLLYVYLSSVRNYWTRLGVPCVKGELLFGSARRVLFTQEPLPACIQRICQQLGDAPFGGFHLMMTPCLMVKDVKLINRILVDDFAYFTDRVRGETTRLDPLAQHLFCLSGDLWREMRLWMMSAFSAERCRRDFELARLCCERLQQRVAAAVHAGSGRDFSLRELLDDFTTDVIGMCAFGIECGAIDDPHSQFRRIESMILPDSKKYIFGAMIGFMMPRIGAALGVRFYSSTVKEFFDRVVMETIDHRKKNNILWDDLVQLMMELKDNKFIYGRNGEEIEVTDNLVVAQMLMAFVKGFQMTSSTMGFCLHELSLNPEMQTRARKEIDAALCRHGGELTYEAIQEMPYMDMLVAETLRLYPMQTHMMRQCTKAYRVPGSGLLLPRGTMVFLPVLALQRDPRCYPDPLRFDPQRFAAGKGAAVDAPYWPFGDGPRACIGRQFALAVVKAGLATLLSRFEFRRCARSLGRPADFEPHKFFTIPAGGLWLRVCLRPWLPLH